MHEGDFVIVNSYFTPIASLKWHSERLLKSFYYEYFVFTELQPGWDSHSEPRIPRIFTAIKLMDHLAMYVFIQ